MSFLNYFLNYCNDTENLTLPVHVPDDRPATNTVPLMLVSSPTRSVLTKLFVSIQNFD